MATGAVGEQVQLPLFDAILHLAALTVEPIAEFLWIARQSGDDEAEIVAPRVAFGLRQDATLPVSGGRTVA